MPPATGCGAAPASAASAAGTREHRCDHPKPEIPPLEGRRQGPERAHPAAAGGGAAGAVQPLVVAEQVARIVVSQLLAASEIANRQEPGATLGQTPAAGRLAGVVEQVVEATARRQEQVVVELEQVARPVPA